MLKHCQNCMFPRNCANAGTQICANKPENTTSGADCTTECFICKHEDKCLASCKGKNAKELKKHDS